MAEYLVKDTSLTAIANEIRTLSGTTGTMDLDAMKTNVATANDNVNTEAELIAQIASALEGKASGGSADPVLQDKSVTPTTSTQTVTPDSGYDGLSKVTVDAMPTATQATPDIIINFSSGLITASATQTAGYVSAGTKSTTEQLKTQAAKTITPSTNSQTAVAKNVYTTGAVTVAAIPSTYVKPTATKAATTYTPTTSNQTIAAGTYCSGVQTIKGDANLIPANILGGKSIFGVSGGIETFDGSYECSGDSTGGSSGSGGASVETCTVKIYAPHGGYSVCYTTAETGSVHSAIQGNIFGGSWATFTNVVSGSVVSVISAGRTGNNSVETDKATLLHVDTQSTNHDYWFEINAMTGETATIYIPPSGSSSGGSN